MRRSTAVLGGVLLLTLGLAAGWQLARALPACCGGAVGGAGAGGGQEDLPPMAVSPWENELAAALDGQRPAGPQGGAQDVAGELTQALGLGAVLPQGEAGKRLTTQVSGALPGGEVRTLGLGFQVPAVTLRGLWLHHSAQATQVVVLLHGHNSSPALTAGLEGEPDYMARLGRHLYDAGFDVVLPQLGTNGLLGGFLNSKLAFFGVQVQGLWTRGICDFTEGLELKQKYQRVLLYGMSNGGLLADLAGTLCQGFDLVVADDSLEDWPAAYYENAGRMYRYQQSGLYFLTPLWARVAMADLVSAGAPPKVYLRSQEFFQQHLAQTLANNFSLTKGPVRGPRSLVFKQNNNHEVEPELVLKVLQGADGLEGLGLE